MLLVKHSMAPFEVAGSEEKRDVTGRVCNLTPADLQVQGQQLPAELLHGSTAWQKLPPKPPHKGLLRNLWLVG